MKKTTTILLAFTALLLLNTNVNAQAFEKGTINVDLGIGLGIYGTSQTSTYELKADVFGTPISEKSTRDTTDGAASTVVPFSFEYGVGEKLGIGLDITYSNYIINDSDRVFLRSVKAFDFGPKFYYHPLSSDKYDLVLGLGLGFTSITWNYETVFNSTPESSKGSGFYLNLDIKNKFFFSDNVGIYVNVGYKGNFYSAISRDHTADEAALESLSFVSNVSIKDEFTWIMHGANIGIGLALKF